MVLMDDKPMSKEDIVVLLQSLEDGENLTFAGTVTAFCTFKSTNTSQIYAFKY